MPGKLIHKEYICASEPYGPGGTKRMWYRVGEICTWEKEDGKQNKTMKLYMNPPVTYSIFPDKKKEKKDPNARPSTEPARSFHDASQPQEVTDKSDNEDLPF